MIISDKAVEIVLHDSLLSRDKFRSIKSFDKKQMERYIASIYRSGFEDGFKAAEDMPSDHVNVEWADVLEKIGEVKGVGEKLLSAIDCHLREVFENETD